MEYLVRETFLRIEEMGLPSDVVFLGDLRSLFRGERLEDGTEGKEAGLADGFDRTLFVFYSGELDNDGVVTRDGDVGLLDRTEVLYATCHDLSCDLEQFGVGFFGSRQDDRGASLEVESESWGESGRDDGSEASPSDGEDDDEAEQPF